MSLLEAGLGTPLDRGNLWGEEKQHFLREGAEKRGRVSLAYTYGHVSKIHHAKLREYRQTVDTEYSGGVSRVEDTKTQSFSWIYMS